MPEEKTQDIHPKIKEIQSRFASNNLVDMVHEHMSRKDYENQQQRIKDGKVGKYYPSSVGNCRRQTGYRMMGYPGKPKDGTMALILENGTSFHDRMERIFDEMGILIAPELKLKNEELRISGRSDAIIWNFMKDPESAPEDEEPITLESPVYDEDGKETGSEVVYEGPPSDVLIVELKSAKNRSYEDYTPKTKPQKKHEMQLQLYLHLTGINQGLVYYENKNTQGQKYFLVDRNEKIISDVLADIKYNIDHYDRGELPMRDYEPTSFECRYCDFRDLCYPVKNTYDIDDIL